MTQSFEIAKATGTSSQVADVTPYTASAKYFAAGLFTLASLGVTGIAYTEQPPQGGWTSISTPITAPSSLVVSSAGSLANRVEDLKARTGLSWTQFSSLFGVTRRAVHFWARGGNMTDEHVARLSALQQSLSGVVGLDSRAARANSSAQMAQECPCSLDWWRKSRVPLLPVRQLWICSQRNPRAPTSLRPSRGSSPRSLSNVTCDCACRQPTK